MKLTFRQWHIHNNLVLNLFKEPSVETSIISKNSWHYQVTTRYDSSVEENLCAYIQMFFASVVTTSFISAFIGAAVIGCVMMFFAWIETGISIQLLLKALPFWLVLPASTLLASPLFAIFAFLMNKGMMKGDEIVEDFLEKHKKKKEAARIKKFLSMSIEEQEAETANKLAIYLAEREKKSAAENLKSAAKQAKLESSRNSHRTSFWKLFAEWWKTKNTFCKTIQFV